MFEDDDKFDDEEYDEKLADEYEFYEDWLNRDGDEFGISLSDYNDMRCAEEYGYSNPYSSDHDDDSDDPEY